MKNTTRSTPIRVAFVIVAVFIWRGGPSFPAYLEKGPCAQSAAADRNPKGAPSKLRLGGDFPRLNASQK